MCRGKLRTQSTARTLGQKDTANQKSRFGPPGRNPQSMIASKPTQKWGSEREGLNNLVNILSLSFFFFCQFGPGPGAGPNTQVGVIYI